MSNWLATAVSSSKTMLSGPGSLALLWGKAFHSYCNSALISPLIAGDNPAVDEHPIHGGVETLLHVLVYSNQ